MSTAWPIGRLGDLCSFENGDRGKNYPSKDAFVAKGIPFINAGNLSNNGVSNDGLNFITRDRFELLSNGKIRKGDILFCLRGSLGKFAVVEDLDEGAIASSLVILRNGENLSRAYLAHFLGSPLCSNQISAYQNGAAQPNLSARDLKFFEIPLPPLAEQQRIAAILDKADALRRKRQQAIDLADQFLRSVFLEMFGDPVTNPKGWDELPLAKGIQHIDSGWSASGDNAPATKDQLGVLKISAVTSGFFRPEENKAVEVSNVPAGKKLLKPRAGDLLFSRANTRELVAATAIVNQDYDNLFLPDKLWRVDTNEKLLPEFLHFLLKQPRMRDRLTSQATGTSGSMLNISKKKFEETPAIFPPADAQLRFAEVFRKTREIGASEGQSAEELNHLFNSLSQKAFSGQL